MDYEQKYKEALERARSLHKDALINANSARAKHCELIFPELKESDGERIRKQIISFLKEFEHDHYRCLDFSSWIAWLERQGEQKPVDKVEPKFKVGDWIVFNDLTLYINEVVQGYYRTISKGGIPNSYDWGINNAARLWTINEARDGDILRLGDVIAIFKKYIGREKCICYCSFCDNCYCSSCDNVGFEIPIENGEDNVYGCTNTTPATKGERNLLFQKMKEAGYTWDSDKKELIKL